jgi:hypothetical protein
VPVKDVAADDGTADLAAVGVGAAEEVFVPHAASATTAKRV